MNENAVIPITVLMPAFNAEKYIGAAIASVLRQSFTDFELLIVNDGSTDGTESVIRSFNDERIVLIGRANGGVAAALNTGLEKARGEFIARFDADDICYSDRLMQQYQFLQSHPDYVLTGSDVDYITEQGEFLFHHHCFAYTHHDITEKLHFYCPFIHAAVMYRKKPVMELGGYNLMAHNFEDYLLWTQLIGKGKVNNLPQSLIKVRLNPASVTIDEKWRGRRFRKLKKDIIIHSRVTVEQEQELLHIIRNQDSHHFKTGAYYALVAKKYLVNNYQPLLARENIRLAMRTNPYKLESYLLYPLTFFSRRLITFLHSFSPNRL